MKRYLNCKLNLCIFILIFGIGFFHGCVSNATFEAHKQEVNRSTSYLQSELQKLKYDIAVLRSEIDDISSKQESMHTDVSRWLEKSEVKLKEMESRVVEIRLLLRKNRKAYK